MSTKKEIFRTPVSEPKTTITPSGEEEEDVISMRLDETGKEEFYISGKTNVYEKIQAYAEETKLENILARCLETGDMSVLEQATKQYIDISELPGNIFEAHEKIKAAENTFMSLPLEIRKKYDFSFDKYMADFGSEEWLNNMGIAKKEDEPKVEIKELEEVKAE